MKKYLLFVAISFFSNIISLTAKSQLLYQNNMIGTRTYNPGLGTNNTPIIIFDDINFPSSTVGMADSVVINQIKVAIGRAPGAPAVSVKVYAASADPAFSSLNSLPAIPPTLVGTIDLPAGGSSNIFTVGDGVTPLFTFAEDTGRVFTGYQTLFVGLSFSDSSNFSASSKNNGWYFSNGPDFNYDLVFKYDVTNLTTPRTSFNFFGSFNLPATFYTQVYGTVKFASPLPVTLNDFNVTNQDNKNIVTWKTETENNSDLFIIEHSANGQSFKSIGQVRAAGNSNSVLSYRFTDNGPVAGINYYRIYTVDKDNKGVYSPIKSIRNSNVVLFNLYPNPVVNSLNVLINTDKSDKAFISVTDLSGKQVYSRSTTVAPGKNILNIEMNNASKGAYVLKVQLSTDAFIKKFTKIK